MLVIILDIEGMPAPLDYLVEIKNLDDATRRRVLWDNARELSRPAAP